jgi:hypothetical protein
VNCKLLEFKKIVGQWLIEIIVLQIPGLFEDLTHQHFVLPIDHIAHFLGYLHALLPI